MGDLIGCFAKLGLLDSGYGGRAALDVHMEHDSVW